MYGIIIKIDELDGYGEGRNYTYTRHKSKTIMRVFPDYHEASKTFEDLADMNDEETTTKILWEGHLTEIKEIK